MTLVDTGLQTMTGGKLKDATVIGNETFLLTYGDGVANVDLEALFAFHQARQNGSYCCKTNCSIRRTELSGNQVVKFRRSLRFMKAGSMEDFCDGTGF